MSQKKPQSNTGAYDNRERVRTVRGVSLIEVLISIGVIAIGLLGTVALIPVAGRQAAEGARNDRMANVGKRVFRQIEQQGLLNPMKWHQLSSGGQFTPVDVRLSSSVTSPGLVPYPPPASSGPRIPFPLCLDPWGFSRPWNTAQEVLSRAIVLNWPYKPNTPGVNFGNSRLSSASMLRFTLAGNTPGTQITAAQADEICIVPDDLEFILPDNNSAPPTQKMLRDGPMPSGVPMKRDATSRYSWMVMFVPEQRWLLLNDAPYRGPYEVSVVIFENRDKDIAQFGKYETVAPVKWVDGWSGGQVTLWPDPVSSTNSSTADQPANEIFRRAKKGQWIMLAGARLRFARDLQLPQGTYAGWATDYAWYRIAAIQKSKDPSEAGTTGTAESVQLSLQGPDWKITRPPGGDRNNYVYAVYFGNVVAVYRKTMYLDTSQM